MNKALRIVFALLFVFFVDGYATEGTNFDKNKHKPWKGDTLVLYAQHFLGVPYSVEGNSSNGFDNMGFARYIYARFGYYLPNDFALQMKNERKVSFKNARPGDLIYFKQSAEFLDEPGHVGIVVENNKGRILFIHCSVGMGIRIDELEDKYYEERVLGTRRVIGVMEDLPITMFTK